MIAAITPPQPRSPVVLRGITDCATAAATVGGAVSTGRRRRARLVREGEWTAALVVDEVDAHLVGRLVPHLDVLGERGVHDRLELGGDVGHTRSASAAAPRARASSRPRPGSRR